LAWGNREIRIGYCRAGVDRSAAAVDSIVDEVQPAVMVEALVAVEADRYVVLRRSAPCAR